jgi:hypothetical protein
MIVGTAIKYVVVNNFVTLYSLINIIVAKKIILSEKYDINPFFLCVSPKIAIYLKSVVSVTIKQ